VTVCHGGGWPIHFVLGAGKPCSYIRPVQEGIPTQSIPDRFEVIADLVKDSDVLDLGVVDARVARGNADKRFERSGKILFFRLAEINRTSLGWTWMRRVSRC
jgi:hypothetical protein